MTTNDKARTHSSLLSPNVVARVGVLTTNTHKNPDDHDTSSKDDKMLTISVDCSVYKITCEHSGCMCTLTSSEEGCETCHDECCNREPHRSADLSDGMAEPTKGNNEPIANTVSTENNARTGVATHAFHPEKTHAVGCDLGLHAKEYTVLDVVVEHIHD